jgi:hypothetical protein
VIRRTRRRCQVPALAFLVTAVGCGFRSPSGEPDASPPTDTDAPPTDASIDGAPLTCMPRWRTGTIAFDAPSQLTELGSSQVDRDPVLTSDELTIYFSTMRSGTFNADIFTATRASLTEAFGTPQRQPIISSADEDSRFTMSADGLTAVVASSRSGTEGNSDLWLATRTGTALPFTAFLSSGVANINDSNAQLDPELSADGQRIYLAVGNPQRIAVSQRSSPTGDFGNDSQLPVLFSNAGDADPTLSPDELVIVYSSHRTDGGGEGNGDLWYATRASKNDDFGMPKRVPNVNQSGAGDGDPALSPDGCRAPPRTLGPLPPRAPDAVAPPFTRRPSRRRRARGAAGRHRAPPTPRAAAVVGSARRGRGR